ncbi:rhomboid family intramembrane serine protease [Bifidobacterium pullorum subsp. saeculare]|uniref:Rhomboid family intramembrane serine protease n=1 Tax=Bifidobacterium pullorum subsp. saeculare TaxID=78257 RepID=A0A938WYV3_9BIFI|nr:rhomboid family intramembrane serine protease [Bifidobacterium pullorum]MBM6700426.1 rhomboid family intramembrane serine protease [Bifidobacterium pullorum subsp. saeculare]
MQFHIPTKQQIRNEWRLGEPVVTKAIIALCVAVWVVEIVLRLLSPRLFDTVVGGGMMMPLTVLVHPWTWLTSMFLHAPSILHILFNMIALYSVGPVLERMMGHWRYLALYLISGLGGTMGLVVWARLTGDWFTAAYGASGALFGLFAAVLVVYRRVGADIRSMLVWMAVNFLLPLVVGGIAWQAHVGGFLVGSALTWLLVRGLPALRHRSFNQRMAIYGGAVTVVVLVVIALCAPHLPPVLL